MYILSYSPYHSSYAQKWASAVRKVSISFKETKSASNENFHQAPAQNPPIAGNSINSPSPKSLQNFDHTSLNSNTTRRDSGGVTSQPPNESLLKINDVKQREPVMQTQVANKPSPLSKFVLAFFLHHLIKTDESYTFLCMVIFKAC